MKYLFILLLAGCTMSPDVTTIRCDMEGVPTLGSVRLINDFVNGFEYVPDAINYHAGEYWASPAEFFKNGGDCEDYAITKYCMIQREGLSDDMEFIAKGRHIVLRVDNMILDNLTGHILSVK